MSRAGGQLLLPGVPRRPPAVVDVITRPPWAVAVVRCQLEGKKGYQRVRVVVEEGSKAVRALLHVAFPLDLRVDGARYVVEKLTPVERARDTEDHYKASGRIARLVPGREAA